MIRERLEKNNERLRARCAKLKMLCNEKNKECKGLSGKVMKLESEKKALLDTLGGVQKRLKVMQQKARRARVSAPP